MELSLHDPFYKEKAAALNALYQVIDPELLINIVDLGLVYDLDFQQEATITVTMTLSTPFCPLGEAITTGVKNALETPFPDKAVDVRLVWDPPWTPNPLLFH